MDNRETQKPSWIHTKKGKAMLIATIATLVVVIGIVLGIHIYYMNRWYSNTWIGDREVSGMTYEESAELINQVFSTYQLKITGRNNGTLTIQKDDIDYQVDIKDSLQKKYDEQHDSLPFFSLGKKKQIDIDLGAAYNKKKLDTLVRQSDLSTGSESYPVTQPQNAKVVFSPEKKYLVIEKEYLGNTLNHDDFLNTIEKALQSGHEKLDLTDQKVHPDVYTKPDIYSTDPSLQEKVDACNPVILRWITWTIQKGITETISPKQIYKWCKYKDGKVSFENEAIENWVEKTCFKYKTVGVTRSFKGHNGKTVHVTGGDYGWQIVYDTMLKQLKSALKKTMDADTQKAYMENPNAAQKKALTIKKKTKFANTAFTMNTDDKTKDWDTENFTEIDLTAQKVYVWRNGKVTFKCRTISGKPVKDRQTRTGAYFIKEHQTHRTLRGDNYATPVNNWVRIMWTGTGFHGAPWQPWRRWSKTLYRSRGSHGCLNLSLSDSKKIYDLTKYREMVFIHY